MGKVGLGTTMKNIENYLMFVLSGLLIVLVVLVSFYWDWLDQISKPLDVLTIWFAGLIMLVTSVNSFIMLYKRKKDKQEILIHLQDGDNESSRVKLMQTIMRANLTRAELKGCLGDCLVEGGNFNIPYLGEPSFSQGLLAAQQGKVNTVLIKLAIPDQSDTSAEAVPAPTRKPTPKSQLKDFKTLPICHSDA